MKDAFKSYLTDHPQIKCVFIGVRKTDPFCARLSGLDATDNGWPPFMRCHPILEWSYAQIWDYLQRRNVPYCSLYDMGYTSLGPKALTMPNPFLLRSDGTYGPAFELQDESKERAGRISHG